MCDECHKIIFQRQQRSTGICTACGKAESQENPFAGKKNICKTPCYQSQQKQYRKDHEVELKAYREKYFKDLDPKVRWQRVRKSIMRGPESFLRDQILHIKAHSRNPNKYDPKDDIRREFDLDVSYVMTMWDQQAGKCALTKLPMSHQFNDLCAASIDRIDSSKGHIKGNVQIVCQWINSAKNDFSNSEILGVLDQYLNIRMAAIK
jgi:hypothetical protein